MKLALGIPMLALVTIGAGGAWTTPAAAAPPTEGGCENAALMESFARLRLGQAAKVTRGEDAVTIDVFERGVRREALRVSCDAIAAPIADEVEAPGDKRPSATKVVAGVIVSRTHGGALSLDFPAGVLDLQSVHFVVMYDDSVSLARGERAFYAYARHADGTTVETEGIGNGCGCERTTRTDGTVSVRRLQ